MSTWSRAVRYRMCVTRAGALYCRPGRDEGDERLFGAPSATSDLPEFAVPEAFEPDTERLDTLGRHLSGRDLMENRAEVDVAMRRVVWGAHDGMGGSQEGDDVGGDTPSSVAQLFEAARASEPVLTYDNVYPEWDVADRPVAQLGDLLAQPPLWDDPFDTDQTPGADDPLHPYDLPFGIPDPDLF